MIPDSKVVVTKFESQRLLGFRADAEGNVLAKVYEGVVLLSDQSN